jgi:hypothetical protein
MDKKRWWYVHGRDSAIEEIVLPALGIAFTLYVLFATSLLDHAPGVAQARERVRVIKFEELDKRDQEAAINRANAIEHERRQQERAKRERDRVEGPVRI